MRVTKQIILEKLHAHTEWLKWEKNLKWEISYNRVFKLYTVELNRDELTHFKFTLTLTSDNHISLCWFKGSVGGTLLEDVMQAIRSIVHYSYELPFEERGGENNGCTKSNNSYGN